MDFQKELRIDIVPEPNKQNFPRFRKISELMPKIVRSLGKIFELLQKIFWGFATTSELIQKFFKRTTNK